MKCCGAISVFVAVSCVCLLAQAQSNTPGTGEGNRAVEAIDASVHAEVDGQPHEASPTELSRERAAPLPNAKRLPMTAFWPTPASTPATGAYDKADTFLCGNSSFRPEIQLGAGSERTTAAGRTPSNSSKIQSLLLKTPSAHFSLYGSPSVPSNLRPTLPPAPASADTSSFSAPFGHALSEPASASLFPRRGVFDRKGQASAKRSRQHTRQNTTSIETKASATP